MEKNFKTVEDVLADETFLAWYFSQSGETVENWEKWLATHPEQQILVDEAVKFVSQLRLREKELPSSRIESATVRLNAVVNSMQRDATPVVSIKRSRNRWWIPVAASVLILLAGVIFWKYFFTDKSTITAAYGQLSQNQLPDGSEVTLNANSTVTLGGNWKEGDREVWLKGEAFFNVSKTSTHSKFIVHTSKFDIIVTGTQFNVRNYEDKANVMLTEGSIILKTDDGKELLMKPGEFREFSNATKQVEAKPAKQEAVLAWKDKKLVFDNTSLKEVAKIITEHYGVAVNIADDELGTKTLTGIWPNDDLNTLLQAIEATQDFKVVRSKDSVTFEKP